MFAANLSGRASRPLHYCMHGESDRQSNMQRWLVLVPKGAQVPSIRRASLRQPLTDHVVPLIERNHSAPNWRVCSIRQLWTSAIRAGSATEGAWLAHR